MTRLDDAQRLISSIVSTQGWVGVRDSGIEIHIQGGLSGQKFREMERVAWEHGLILDRIYYHRNSGSLAIRFKKQTE